jgi:hypothetical protein
VIEFFRVSSEAPPKWYRALTISGKPAGLGFQCPKCHLGYPHSAPAEIFHCGALETAPHFTALLPQRSIGNAAQLPPNFFRIGTW